MSASFGSRPLAISYLAWSSESPQRSARWPGLGDSRIVSVLTACRWLHFPFLSHSDRQHSQKSSIFFVSQKYPKFQKLLVLTASALKAWKPSKKG